MVEQTTNAKVKRDVKNQTMADEMLAGYQNTETKHRLSRGNTRSLDIIITAGLLAGKISGNLGIIGTCSGISVIQSPSSLLD